MLNLFRKLSILLSIKPVLARIPNNSDETVINGDYHASNQTISDKLQINGQARFDKNTIVKSTIIINGTLIADGVTFENDYHSNGNATINESISERHANFSGNFSSSKSKFNQEILLLTNQATFSDCQLKSIIVKKLSYVYSAQKIYLKNGSLVSDDINFESGCGVVYVDSTSKLYGNVIGGAVIRT